MPPPAKLWMTPVEEFRTETQTELCRVLHTLDSVKIARCGRLHTAYKCSRFSVYRKVRGSGLTETVPGMCPLAVGPVSKEQNALHFSLSWIPLRAHSCGKRQWLMAWLCRMEMAGSIPCLQRFCCLLVVIVNIYLLCICCPHHSPEKLGRCCVFLFSR